LTGPAFVGGESFLGGKAATKFRCLSSQLMENNASSGKKDARLKGFFGYFFGCKSDKDKLSKMD